MRLSRLFPLVFVGFLFCVCLCADVLHAQSAEPTPLAQQSAAASPIPAVSPTPAPDFSSQLAGRSAEQLHQDGIAALRKSQYPVAITIFEAALRLAPTNASVLYNLGLAQFRSGHSGLALGFWRKALAFSPGFSLAKDSIEWLEKRLPHGGPKDSSTWEQFRETFLVDISLTNYLFLVLLLLLLSGWLLLRHAGNRRKALLDERPLPPFPWVACVFLALWMFSVFLVIVKIIDDDTTRATIVVEKVPALTAPDASSTSLFDLFEGYEVIVRNSADNWLQVTQANGSGMTGWVPNDSVMVTSKTAQAQK